MMKLITQLGLLALLCVSNSYSQVRLIAVDPLTQNITIENFGSSEVDISKYRFCSHLTYTADLDTDGDVTIVSGDLQLSQNETVTLNWSTTMGLDVDGRDLGLYLPGPLFVGFDDPDQMVDFMQYLGSFSVPSGRENVAVVKGIWTSGAFVNANGPYTYNGNGTDIGVGFWDGATPACEITALILQTQTPCNPATNTYTQEILITYANEPSTGTLDVNGQSFPITGSPQTVTLTGLISGGQDVDVTASFSENANCFLTEPDFFRAPEECLVCAITDLAAGAQTGCNPATNTYTQEVTVTYQNDPVGGSLDINGQFFSITGSPQTITLTGLVANGKDVAVTARFTANTACNLTISNLFIAPENCVPNELPIAVNDDISTESNIPITIEILMNDNDSDGILNPESVQIVDAPGNGQAAANQDGTVTYTPNPDFHGTDSFTYTIEDDNGATSNLATVSITVELITALNSFSDPVLSNVSIKAQANGIYLQVNKNEINKLDILIADIQGHILHQGKFINSIRDEYILPIPQLHANHILIVRVNANKGSYTKKLYLQSR